MATATAEPKTKPSKTPIILGFILALLGGGGGFYAATKGMLPIGNLTAMGTGESDPNSHGSDNSGDGASTMMPDVRFVIIPPLLISLGPASASRHLRFAAQLEIQPGYEPEVEALMPRIVDVLNSYLRAVETGDFDDTAILLRLRVQMLRRVQLVAGPDKVRDLLIMEFVFD